MTVSQNSALTGGGINLFRSDVNLINSNFWNNSPEEVSFNSTDTPNSIIIDYSNIEGGQDSIITNDNGTVTWGDGNIDVDPVFVDATDGNYHLLATSQLINGGHPDSMDSDGSRADIGAYPYLNSYSGPTWYITESGNDTTATGASDDPFRSIQSGINFSSDDDSVTAAAGTYVENINFRGRNIRVAGADRETTIIDGDSSGSVVIFSSGEDSSTLLINFTIQNGSATNGGGIYCSANSSPTLSDLIILNNLAGSGGGMMIYNFSNPLIKNVIFEGNSVTSNGSALFCWARSSPTIRNCIFEGNAADGAVIYSEDKSDPTFINVTITGNTVDNYNSTYTTAVYASGGSAEDSMKVRFLNSVIFNEGTAQIKATGDYNRIDISYSNVLHGQDSIVINDNATITWGDGNIDVDPRFVDEENDNYHLLASSQLINGGHPDSLDSDGSRADIGAYPYLNSYSGPTWYITESGNDTTATGASDDPFRSIQTGINFSSDADSITVGRRDLCREYTIPRPEH